MLLSQSSVVLIDVVVVRNVAKGSGGGVFLSVCDGVLNATSLSSNSATLGGGLFVSETRLPSHLTLNGVNVRGNTATENGGGMFCQLSKVAMAGCLVTDNAASTSTVAEIGHGGGIFATLSTTVNFETGTAVCGNEGAAAQPNLHCDGGSIVYNETLQSVCTHRHVCGHGYDQACELGTKTQLCTACHPDWGGEFWYAS